MRLSLIGMSNIGKSAWAQRLATGRGCTPVHCDALIEERLRPQLAAMGLSGLTGLATWMGFPDEARYARNSSLYLAAEQEVMRSVLAKVIEADVAVIDTTGSVIYTGTEILTALRATTRVVYLESPQESSAEMIHRYQAHPKPVLWDRHYLPLPGEQSAATLARCYPDLLSDRTARYRALAHITIPFAYHQDSTADIEALVAASQT